MCAQYASPPSLLSQMKGEMALKRAEEKRGRVTVTDFYPTWQLLIFKTVPESQFSFDVC